MQAFTRFIEVLLDAPDRQVFLVFGVLIVFITVAGGFPGLGTAPKETRRLGSIVGPGLIGVALLLGAPFTSPVPIVVTVPAIARQEMEIPAPIKTVMAEPMPTRKPTPVLPTPAPMPTSRPFPTPGFPSLNKP